MEYFYLRYKDNVLTPFLSKEKMPDRNDYYTLRTDFIGRFIKTSDIESFTKDINLWKSHLIPYKWKSQEDLENVKNQLYSSKIAKDAEIELKQNSILEEDGFQIKEEMNKE